MPTPTERVRDQARTKMAPCPNCGRPMISMQKASKDAGVTYLTFRAFLNGGTVNSDTLDKIATWTETK